MRGGWKHEKYIWIYEKLASFKLRWAKKEHNSIINVINKWIEDFNVKIDDQQMFYVVHKNLHPKRWKKGHKNVRVKGAENLSLYTVNEIMFPFFFCKTPSILIEFQRTSSLTWLDDGISGRTKINSKWQQETVYILF